MTRLCFDSFFRNNQRFIFLSVTRISFGGPNHCKAEPLFKDVSPFVLISARWSPTISPPLSLVVFTHALERTPLRTSPLPSPFVLSPCSLNGEIGRTLNGQHINPEGQDICSFPWKLKAHEHWDGDKTAGSDLLLSTALSCLSFSCSGHTRSSPLSFPQKPRCGNPLMILNGFMNI